MLSLLSRNAGKINTGTKTEADALHQPPTALRMPDFLIRSITCGIRRIYIKRFVVTTLSAYC